MCTIKYEKVCDLERHIKSVHKEHDKFECGKCEKSIVTKWRLKKHVKMHFKLHLRECHYYKTKSYCPFEDLGCKFGHGTVNLADDTIENINDTNEMLDEKYSDMLKEDPTNPESELFTKM